MRDSKELTLLKYRANSAIIKALRNGELSRPDTCELCGSKPGYTEGGRCEIHAHHWNGYDDPLNIWWLCRTCNRRLPGPQYHNGSVTKQEALQIINQINPATSKERKQCQNKFV